MEADTTLCFACLRGIEGESDIVDLNTLYDEEKGLTYGDCIEFCLNITLNKNVQSIVCNDCSLELEISYKFLRKVMLAQNMLQEEAESEEEILNENSTDDQEVQLSQEINDEDIYEEMTECVAADGEWHDLSEEAAVIVVTEQEDLQPNTVSNDDIIEELPCEEIEVYTNDAETEKVETETAVDDCSTDQLSHTDKYNCDLCGKVFPNYSRMTAHRRCHKKPRATFNCVECGRMYASDQALSVHIRTAHKQEGFTCPVCSKNFVIERSLEIHMRYHTRDFPFECKDCGKHFAQKSHLNTHQNVKHNGLRFICVHPNCNKLFNSSAALRDHEFSHLPKNPFECEFCKKSYPSKSKLKFHVRQTHNMDLSLDELEHMRLFFVKRSPPNTIITGEQPET